MHTVSKKSILNHRGPRASTSWKSLSPASSTSSLSSTIKSEGSLADIHQLWTQGFEISTGISLLRDQRSFLSLKDSVQKPSIELSVLSRESSVDTLAFGHQSHELPLYLRCIFIILSVFKIDKFLERAVFMLEGVVHLYPSLLYFEFVRELVHKERMEEVKYDRRMPRPGPSLVTPNQFAKPGPSLTRDYSTDTFQGFEEEPCDDKISSQADFSPSVSVESNDDMDEWGHFADFQDDSSCFQDNDLGDPYRSLIRNRHGTVMSSLSPLVETEEDYND